MIPLAHAPFIVGPGSNVCRGEWQQSCGGSRICCTVKFRSVRYVLWSSLRSAPLGGAVTHSPSAASRSGCRAGARGGRPRVLGGSLERERRRERGERPVAGIERRPLLANSGKYRVFPCVHGTVSQGCHRCVRAPRGRRWSVEVPVWVWMCEHDCLCPTVGMPVPLGHTTLSCHAIYFGAGGRRRGGPRAAFHPRSQHPPVSGVTRMHGSSSWCSSLAPALAEDGRSGSGRESSGEETLSPK